jgi:peptide/nickel transport system ATP-binding protein
VVHHISDRVAVMYVGKLVELAERQDLFFAPRHPYTEALLSSLPQPDPDIKLQRIVMTGDVADPANRPSGCCFHPRCLYAREICRREEPPLVDIAGEGEGEHLCACHLAGELNLTGVAEAH